MSRLSCLLVSVAWLVKTVPAVGGEPGSRSYVLDTLHGWLRGDALAEPGRLLAGGNFHPVAEAAACQVRAWEWTGEPRYAEGAARLLKALVAAGDGGREDFFVAYPMMYSYVKLDAGGRLTPELRRDFRAFAGEQAETTTVRVAPESANLSVTIGRDDRWRVEKSGLVHPG